MDNNFDPEESNLGDEENVRNRHAAWRLLEDPPGCLYAGLFAVAAVVMFLMFLVAQFAH